MTDELGLLTFGIVPLQLHDSPLHAQIAIPVARGIETDQDLFTVAGEIQRFPVSDAEGMQREVDEGG